MKQILLLLFFLSSYQVFSQENNKLNFRFTAVSVPIETIVRHNLNFLNTKGEKNRRVMTNAKFAELLKKIQETKGTSLIFDISQKAAPLQTLIIEETKPVTIPKDYNSDGKEIIAGNSEIRKIGTDIEATYVLSRDSKTINLDFRTKVSKLSGWRTYDKKHNIRMPVIRSFSQESRVNLEKGTTVCLLSLYDKQMPKNYAHSLQKKVTDAKCLLIYISASPEIKAPLEAPKVPKKNDIKNIFHSIVQLEVTKKAAQDLLRDNGHTLKKESVTKLYDILASRRQASILSINNGVSLSGETTVSHNIMEIYTQEGAKKVTLNNQPFSLPVFKQKKIGTKSTITLMTNFDKKSCTIETNFRHSYLKSWNESNAPLIEESPQKKVLKFNYKDIIIFKSPVSDSSFGSEDKVKLLLFSAERF